MHNLSNLRSNFDEILKFRLARTIFFFGATPTDPFTDYQDRVLARGPSTPSLVPVNGTHSKKRVSTSAGRPRSEEQVSPRQG